MRKKITVVGAGNVGATTAHWLAMRELADVVLVDIAEGIPQGKALDLRQAMPIIGKDVALTGSNGYAETAGSDIVIITAGLARKPGMSRDDLLKKNYEVMESCVGQVVKHSPNSILILVTNPLDAMAQAAYKLSK
ncbi:MAG: lactate/malate family dehydrogenase, partial [Terriglobales bacterium]